MTTIAPNHPDPTNEHGVDPVFQITNLQQLVDHQTKAGNGLVYNDRGNGSAGGHYHATQELLDMLFLPGFLTQTLMIVSEKDDDDAWQLARDAFKTLGMDGEPTAVFVGEREDAGHQSIWAI